MSDEYAYYNQMDQGYEEAMGYAAQAEAEQENYEASIAWVSWIESRVRRSLLDDKRKAEIFERLAKSQNENELKAILVEAEANQPIMGLEIIPQGQGFEMTQAIQNRADRDDLYDRHKK